MNDIIVAATGVPLKFPDPREEAYARAQEFRRLPPDRRWHEILELMEFGLNMVHTSPRRADIEKHWQEQEDEWQRIQQNLFANYRK